MLIIIFIPWRRQCGCLWGGAIQKHTQSSQPMKCICQSMWNRVHQVTSRYTFSWHKTETEWRLWILVETLPPCCRIRIMPLGRFVFPVFSCLRCWRFGIAAPPLMWTRSFMGATVSLNTHGCTQVTITVNAIFIFPTLCADHTHTHNN